MCDVCVRACVYVCIFNAVNVKNIDQLIQNFDLLRRLWEIVKNLFFKDMVLKIISRFISRLVIKTYPLFSIKNCVLCHNLHQNMFVQFKSFHEIVVSTFGKPSLKLGIYLTVYLLYISLFQFSVTCIYKKCLWHMNTIPIWNLTRTPRINWLLSLTNTPPN